MTLPMTMTTPASDDDAGVGSDDFFPADDGHAPILPPADGGLAR